MFSKGLTEGKMYDRLNYMKEETIIKRLRGTPFYKAWHNMKQRCINPNHKQYHNYGGRGINVCDEWQEFINFFVDMYELYEYHTEHYGTGIKNCNIDRIDNNKGYSKDNCRWVTSKINQNNRREYRRMGRAKYIERDGKKLCIKDWAKELGIHHITLRWRLKNWGEDRAFKVINQ